jgi:signal transduction histidine kinase
VTAVSLLAEKLGEKPERETDREELREITNLLSSNITRASNLIQGFKKIAVDESGDDIRSFDLISYIERDLIPSLNPMLKKKGHGVTVDAPEICIMHSYPGAIAQIVTNLVLNASIHAYGNIRPGIITIGIECDDSEVEIRIADRGKGMDKQTKSHIYEPFFTTDKENGGSGLGLMIVYNLVHKKLNGHLKCSTEPGKGTEFTITIPGRIKINGEQNSPA